MRWLITALIVFTLAGCGLARQQAMLEAKQRIEAERKTANAECDRQYGAGKMVPRIKCQNAVLDAANQKYNATGFDSRNMDLVASHNARRVVIAEKYDKGKLTKAEVEAAMAASRTQGISAEHGRNTATASVLAQQRAAAAARRPTTTNCNAIGNSVNCTTY